MCGIAGAVGTIDEAVRRAVARASEAQAHRGPDADGDWAAVDGAGRGPNDGPGPASPRDAGLR